MEYMCITDFCVEFNLYHLHRPLALYIILVLLAHIHSIEASFCMHWVIVILCIIYVYPFFS